MRLMSSKTDQTRVGMDIYVGRTHNELCPVVAMLCYLAVRGFDKGSLFQSKNGTPLTRQELVGKVKTALSQAGIDPSHYSGHSFRIGAATTAAACGINDATIQLLGCWKSDWYMRYIRHSHQQLATACSPITQVTTSITLGSTCIVIHCPLTIHQLHAHSICKDLCQLYNSS